MPILKLFTTWDRSKDIVLVHFGQCMTHAMKTLHPNIGLWGLTHVGAGGGNIEFLHTLALGLHLRLQPIL